MSTLSAEHLEPNVRMRPPRGAPPDHRRVLGRLLLTIVSLSAVVLGGPGVAAATSPPSAAGTAYEGMGSASAEEAVSVYMTGLAEGDVDQMTSAFAIETYVDHFDMRAYLAWLRVYSPLAGSLTVPPDTPFSRALGVAQRHANVVGQITQQFLGVALPDLDLTQVVVLDDDSAIDEFSTSLTDAVDGMDTTNVDSFVFVPTTDVDADAAARYDSDQNQKNVALRRTVLGADEITDLIVRFEVNGQTFLGFFSVVRYGESWWLEQLGGNFASLAGVPTLRAGALPAGDIGG